jgi:acetoin:2,6-dichlorophenolindophenol oxidoreductase subunit beta
MSAVAQPQDSAQVTMTYLEAIVQAQIEEMERDERVIMMAEDIAIYGDGKVIERFGPSRVWSMPISENSFTGLGIGAAISGLRPIVSIGIASFAYLAADQIINQAAKLHYMTGGQVQVPAVFRFSMYHGKAIAAQHSDRPYPLFMNVPGLKIVCPSSPADIKGLLKTSVRDDDPVVFFEDSGLWASKGPVPVDPDLLVPLGKADVKRAGGDATIVAISGSVRHALEAAHVLAAEGIECEVLDPRTLKPLDIQSILGSVAKTGRLVLVEPAHRICGATSEIAAVVCEEAFECLKKPIRRVSAPDVHVPFSPVLEQQLYPNRDRIVAAVREIL